jgi:hypothetical protein
MARPYILPNRKAFADAVARIFLKYPTPPQTQEDKDVDLCLKRDSGTRELLPHQKIVRDYLALETPYRGLLLYHGLGSGKTCSSIAVAESLLTTKKVFVMLPASLESNYRGELQTCGAPLYLYDHHWRQQALSDDSREIATRLGISDGFLDRQGFFFTTVPGEEPNFTKLPKTAQDAIQAQFDDVLAQRFTFIRYNGLSSANISKYVPEDGSNPYSGSVVIIDEVHNFISRVINESELAGKLYERIYTAVDCKVVTLSGTPVINRANEVAYLMNLLRGPIERISIPIKSIPTWDEEKMTTVLRGIPDLDTIEFNTLKKILLVTRNPPNFRSVYSEKGERMAVQYIKDMAYTASPQDWVSSWKSTFETEVGGAELATDRITVEQLECLPTKYEDFASLFLDGLQIKNANLFQRRIQGLVSYFKGADERMLPKVIEPEQMLEAIPMSPEQFNHYLAVRFKEIQQNKRRATMGTDDKEMKTFRVNSRLACNYAIPPDLRQLDTDDAATEDQVPPKEAILNKLRADPKRFLSEDALKSFSPKMLAMLKNIKASMGTAEAWSNQFVYSQYRELEGLGVFSAILDANGWQEYRIVKEANQWVEDPTMAPDKPAYAFYTGAKAGDDAQKREYIRQIFNGPASYARDFPPSLKASVEARGKKILCVFMASSAGAEGITLLNVRRVHIMEPHWNPARHDQVIGRAVRICSHATLPQDERTVKVSFYLSVFTEEQSKSTEGSNNVVLVRRSDMGTKRYAGDPQDVFLTTDEYLYEISYEKDVTTKRISTLLKSAAVDCELHRKLHSKETPVISCMRFDSTATGDDLAYKPNVKTEDTDLTYLRNMTKRKRKLQKVAIKGMVFLIDPQTKEVYDGPAFEDAQRLLRIGTLTSATSLEWMLP